MQPVFDFIDASGAKPFFIWYAPMMPHTPHNPPARLLRRYKAAGIPLARARYYAMVEWFDETVGALLAHLDRKGLAGNTVVVYVADNGWVQLEGGRPVLESRSKQSPFDAGTRTPIMVRWPAGLAPRRDDRTLVSSIDIAPTVLRACNIEPSRDLPGIALTDRRALARRKAVFGENFVHTLVDIHNPAPNLKYRWTIRERYKLIEPYRPNLTLPVFNNHLPEEWPTMPVLFDVLADPREQKDLAGAHPDLVKSLRAEIDRWWGARL